MSSMAWPNIITRSILLICLFFSALLAGTSPAAGDPPPFTVAFILPLSGRPAEYGIAARNAVELARKNRPELFTNMRFLYEDSLYDGKTAISVFQRFSKVEHADLIFVWGHGPAQAIAPVAEVNGKPTIVITGQKDIADQKNFVIRFCTPHVAFADALLKEVRRRGYRNIALVKTDLGFLDDTVDAFMSGIKSPETSELIGSIQSGDTDFQSLIVKIKSKRPELLGVFLGEDQVPLFVNRMSAMGLNIPLFGTHSLGAKNGIAALRQVNDAAFFSSNFVDENFHRQYVSGFGGDFQITWAANAYDFAILTGELFGNRKENPQANDVIAAYQSVEDRQGVTGRYRFMRDKTFGTGFVFPVVIKTITKTGVEQSRMGE